MSDRGSVRSGASFGRGYHRVAHGSNVDETLFASSHPDSVSRLRTKREKGLVSRERSDLEGKQTEVVLSRRQLDAMKARSIIISQREREEKKREEAEERKVKFAKAQARKERMMQLEAERKSKTILTAEEEEDVARGNATLARAEDMRIESLDQVKNMRRKMMYAQCAKIRESQILDKQLREKEEKACEERLDLQMEIDRLKDLQKYEGIKKGREVRQREDASEIRAQIKERERQRIVEEELLQQEGEQMKLMIRRQAEQEREKRRKHQIESKKLLEEVLAANDEAVTEKARRAEEEKEEDERILRWQEEKLRKEEEHEAEKLAIKAAKDKEFFEVASQMKRSMDTRSEQDALRAKRHQQEQERKQRAAERAQKDRQRKQLDELAVAREEQQRRKIESLKRLALDDKNEWLKISRENAEIQARADELGRKQQEANMRHQRELRDQMHKREQEAAVRKQERRDEGERIKRENERFLRMVENKKAEILKEMENGQIPEKFRAEVERMKVTYN
mmetsp:Transcript_16819/g.42694  ORF Transcript_16819/g.42694 Transcript_16819/m.42694 type:complete len:510 (+) Transcript_16819:188-1717(+)